MRKKEFPLYIQHDAMDCGPTSLRMVAAYYGKQYSAQYLRENCFISRLGVSMLGISEAAETLYRIFFESFKLLNESISYAHEAHQNPYWVIWKWKNSVPYIVEKD